MPIRATTTALAALTALAMLFVPGAAAGSPATSLRRVSIDAAIAAPGGEPVVPRAFLDERIARANRVFAPAELAFELGRARSLDGAHAHLETRRDRHALAAEHRPGAVNVFVVESLRDVDDPSRLRQGVHWRPDRARREVHYVILAAAAGPDVLAHELGHFFGNHRHSETPGNIMSYLRAGEPFFDAAQLRVIARHVTRFVRTGELDVR